MTPTASADALIRSLTALTERVNGLLQSSADPAVLRRAVECDLSRASLDDAFVLDANGRLRFVGTEADKDHILVLNELLEILSGGDADVETTVFPATFFATVRLGTLSSLTALMNDFVVELGRDVPVTVLKKKLELLSKKGGTVSAFRFDESDRFSVSSKSPYDTRDVIRAFSELAGSFIQIATFSIGENGSWYLFDKSTNRVLESEPNGRVVHLIKKNLFNGRYFRYDSTGISGFDLLLREGVPRGSVILLQGNTDEEIHSFARVFVEEGLSGGSGVIYVEADRDPVNILREWNVADGESECVTIDWYSHGSRRVDGVEKDGTRLAVSKDILNVDIAVTEGMDHFGPVGRVRSYINIIHKALNQYDFNTVYNFLDSVIAKLRTRGVTALVAVNKGSLNKRTLSKLQKLFDGVLDIRKEGSEASGKRSVSIPFLKGQLRDTSPRPVYFTLKGPVIYHREVDENELVPALLTIPGIGRKRARAFMDCGFVTFLQLKRSEPEEIAGVRGISLSLSKTVKEFVDTHNVPEFERDFYKEAVAVSLESGAFEYAEEMLSRCLESGVVDPEIMLQKARLEMMKGREVSAFETASRLLATYPGTEPAGFVRDVAVLLEVSEPDILDVPPSDGAEIAICPECGALKESEDAPCSICSPVDDVGKIPGVPDDDTVLANRCRSCSLFFPLYMDACPGCGSTSLSEEIIDGMSRIQCPFCECYNPVGVFECENCSVMLDPDFADYLEKDTGPTGRRVPKRKTPLQPPGKPEKKGLVNGRGRVNGLVNGKGHINGLVNGRGRINGLVNGKGHINGLVNGRGRINGLVNGLVNGLSSEVSEDDEEGRDVDRRSPARETGYGFRFPVSTGDNWRKGLTVFLVLVMLATGITFFLTVYHPPAPRAGSIVDGNMEEWYGTELVDVDDVPISGDGDIETYSGNLLDGRFCGYVRLKGAPFSPESLSVGTVAFFIDVDGSPRTGYRVGGLGAESVFVARYSKGTLRAQGFKYSESGEREGSVKVAVAYTDNEMEFEMFYRIPSPENVTFIPYSITGDGETDTGENPVMLMTLSPAPGFYWTPRGVITENDRIGQVRNIDGVADILGVRIVNLGERLEMRGVALCVGSNGTSFGRVSDPLLNGETMAVYFGSTLRKARTMDIWLEGSLSPYSGRALSMTVESLITANGTVKVSPARRGASYMESAPEEISVDGAFADWENGGTLYGDAKGDIEASSDIIRWGKSMGEGMFLFAEGSSSLFDGLPFPLPTWRSPSGEFYPPDSDGDGILDALDVYPHDFDNDGIDDSHSFVVTDEGTFRDRDGDGVPDYPATGYGGDPDLYLVNDFTGVSLYIGPLTNAEPSNWENALFFHVDADSDPYTGRPIASGIGEDILVGVWGSSGVPTNASLYLPREVGGITVWLWESSIPFAWNESAIELSFPRESSRYVLGDPTVFVELRTWNDKKDYSRESPLPPQATRAGGSVVINEAYPDGSNGWIELYNTDTVDSIDISSWVVDWCTDSVTLPSALVLGPGEYYVVSASGLTSTSKVYLNDSSSNQKDYVALGNPSGSLSWGRYPDGGSGWYECYPTEGAANNIPEFPLTWGLLVSLAAVVCVFAVKGRFSKTFYGDLR